MSQNNPVVNERSNYCFENRYDWLLCKMSNWTFKTHSFIFIERGGEKHFLSKHLIECPILNDIIRQHFYTKYIYTKKLFFFFSLIKLNILHDF